MQIDAQTQSPLLLITFQADVFRQAAGDPSVRLQEQRSHQHAAVQLGQRAGEILEDELRLQRLRQPARRLRKERPDKQVPPRARHVPEGIRR